MSARVDELIARGELAMAAEAALADGDPARAATLFERVWEFRRAAEAARAAGDAAGHVRLLLDVPDVAGAAAAVSSALALQPELAADLARVYESKRLLEPAAALWERAGDPARAVDLYEKAGALLAGARLLGRAGRAAEASRLFERFLREAEETDAADAAPFMEAHLELGRFAARTGRPAEAVRHLQAALRRADATTGHGSDLAREARRLLVVELLALGFPDAAREALRLARAADSALPSTPEELGRELASALAPLAGASGAENPEEQWLAGRWRIVRPLGQGAAGRVFLAEDAVTGEPVAAKLYLRPPDTDDPGNAAARDPYERFLREAGVMRSLRHPNLVEVLAFEPALGLLVMEYLSGGTLTERLRPRLPAAAVIRLLRDACAGLAAAHQRGVVHRDLKPDNLLFDASGRAKVSDFGAAHLLDLGATQTGGFIGTLAYMSPEQITGSPISFAADIYALGVTAFQALCGRLPFQGPDLIEQHLSAAPPRPRSLAPDAPEALERLILRALEKAPQARFASVAELVPLLDEAERALGPTLLSLPSSPAGTPPAASGATEDPGPAAEDPRDAAAQPDEARYEVLGPWRSPVPAALLGRDPWLGRPVLLEPIDRDRGGDRGEGREGDGAALGSGVVRTRLRALARAGGPWCQRVLALAQRQGFVVYEAMAGEPLAALPAPGREQALRAVFFLARALRPLHELGIAHGRIDRDHVYVDGERVTLVSVGVAASPEAAAATLDDDLRAVARLCGEALPELVPAPAGQTLSFPDAAALERWARAQLDAAERGPLHLRALESVAEELGIPLDEARRRTSEPC